MYVEVVPNRNSRPAVLLRESYREDGKVKKRTLANLSALPQHAVDALRRALAGEMCVEPTKDQVEIVRSLPHGHVRAALGSLQKLGLDSIIDSRPSRERDLVLAMIVDRIAAAEPGSKLATARDLHRETAKSSLGQALGLYSIAVDEEDLYGAMDWLLARQARIEAKLAKRHLSNGTLVLYDLSSSYYTGSKCPLAKLGHSRDGKSGFPQINYGLLCDPAGRPIAIEVFEGNTGDPATLSSQVQKVRGRFAITRVVFVGDRGMITAARIREDLAGVEGLDWITSLRAPAIKKLASQGAIQATMFDEQNLAEITSPEYPEERLIVCRNPLLAAERSRKREDLLRATEADLSKIADATRRQRRPLRGKDKIGIRVGKVLNRRKVGKHFELRITDDSFECERNAAKIAEEASLDGIYVVRTSVPADVFDAETAVCRYKDLSKVERAFRSLKTVDLKIRPIFHRLANRVRAHIFLCMLAYYVEWHMREALAPILFHDDDHELAMAQRASVVDPAPRSDRAQLKDALKTTEEGEPVSSFSSLLAHLATLTINRVRLRGSPGDVPEFHLLSTPTPVQVRAFDLLGLRCPV